MKRILQLFILMSIIATQACQPARNEVSVHSPDDQVAVKFFLMGNDQAAYSVAYKGKVIIDTSTLGFEFRDMPALKSGLLIEETDVRSVNETWEMPWGEQREVKNHFRELKVHLAEKEKPHRMFNVIFRVYDDGIGFRYEFFDQANLDSVIIMDELTEFQLTGNHTCWWHPGDWDIYEHLYKTTRFTEIDALPYRNHPNLVQTHIPFNAVNTPITMKTDSNLYLSFHEADLTNYAGMTLAVNPAQLKMTSELVGSERLGYKVKRMVPFQTPWRTIQLGEKAGDLLESRLIVNLNEPARFEVPWFTPMKYVGIWLELHLGKSTWSAGEKHGATTENAKRHIDFAAANNFGGVLVEGWNTGWDGRIGPEEREGAFDFVTPYPDFNLEEVAMYAKEKGVQLIMHHETWAAPRAYEQQLDTAYAQMKRLGIHVVKTGYVGQIIPQGEYHHGQWMVNHYRKVVETGAQYDVAINAHEPIKATGLRRTYPNIISREGLRGQEFNIWAIDGGNPPEHLTIVPFTRMLGGPIDFTPGIFNISLKPYKDENQVNTTLTHQLALYVVIYSPVQMAVDLFEHYEGHPAFQFIREVGVDWEQSKVLDAEIGDYIVMARQERGTGQWFLGAITDENSRELTINLDFLEAGKTYQATIYQDGKDAHWEKNPTAYEIRNKEVNAGDSLTIQLAAGGGVAVSFEEVE